jgi:hypothetical protein
MGVSDEAKIVIPLKFLRKIKNIFFPSCKLNPGTYCICQSQSGITGGLCRRYESNPKQKWKFAQRS